MQDQSKGRQNLLGICGGKFRFRLLRALGLGDDNSAAWQSRRLGEPLGRLSYRMHDLGQHAELYR